MLGNLTYEERLKRLDTFSPQKQRIVGKLIEVNEILNKFNNIYDESWLKNNRETVWGEKVKDAPSS